MFRFSLKKILFQFCENFKKAVRFKNKKRKDLKCFTIQIGMQKLLRVAVVQGNHH